MTCLIWKLELEKKSRITVQSHCTPLRRLTDRQTERAKALSVKWHTFHGGNTEHGENDVDLSELNEGLWVVAGMEDLHQLSALFDGVEEDVLLTKDAVIFGADDALLEQMIADCGNVDAVNDLLMNRSERLLQPFVGSRRVWNNRNTSSF